MSAANGRYLFDVEASQAVLDRRREVQREADVGDRFPVSIRLIYEGLRVSAREFGEPLRELPAVLLQIRAGAINNAAVSYAVH